MGVCIGYTIPPFELGVGAVQGILAGLAYEIAFVFGRVEAVVLPRGRALRALRGEGVQSPIGI